MTDRNHRNAGQRKISRLDKWIITVALLWACAGITLLLEGHSARRQVRQPQGYAMSLPHGGGTS